MSENYRQLCFCRAHLMHYKKTCPICDNQVNQFKKSKAYIMAELRKDRAANAERLGLVKLRVEMYTTPADKEKALKYLARLKRDA